MLSIEEISKQYKDEWVLIEVVETDADGNPIKGKVIAHSKDREETYRALRETRAKDVAHFYTGSIPKEGYAVAFGLNAFGHGKR